MKTPQNRFFRLLLDSAWFPAVAWLGGVVVFLGAAIVAAPVRHWCGRWAEDGLGWAALGLVLLLSVAGVAAFVRSLLGRRWGRAVVQLLLGAVAVVLAGVGGICADFLAWEVASRTPGGIPWASTPGDAPMPFAIECRPANPFRDRYDKRIVFPSGQRIRLGLEPGGDAGLAVYALDSGCFAVAVDVRRPGGPHSIYRIDPEGGTVDFLADGKWIRLAETPDGGFTLTTGVPAGDEFAHRRYLGLAEPGGAFDPAPEGDGGDPWAEVLGSGVGR
ncbi:MAG: hypothetical protein IKO01_01445 [Kiritimatiellae bacterium]|nr:hypothetical protein [Kiritimatiellia bacterium]